MFYFMEVLEGDNTKHCFPQYPSTKDDFYRHTLKSITDSKINQYLSEGWHIQS